jgi:O-antigen ligase
MVTVPDASGEPHRVRNENMHLTLMLRTGFVGWAIMMWILGAALVRMYAAMAAVTDRRLALTLWAAFSAGVGFLVSMSNFNAFYNPSIQVLFWGLLGIGTAIATHAGGRRPTFNVIYRFGQGD